MSKTKLQDYGRTTYQYRIFREMEKGYSGTCTQMAAIVGCSKQTASKHMTKYMAMSPEERKAAIDAGKLTEKKKRESRKQEEAEKPQVGFRTPYTAQKGSRRMIVTHY